VRPRLDWIEADEDRLIRLAGLLKGGREDVDQRVVALLERSRRLEKELEQLKAKLASSAGQDLASQAVVIDGIKVLAARLEGADSKALRVTLDQLKDKLGSAVVVLATEATARSA
jgi:alanyl-tRNA synthetase